jgi:hypothetical protein
MIAAHGRQRPACVIALVGCVALGLAVLHLLARWADRWFNEPYLSRAEAVQRGMTEGQTTERLGEPAYVYEAQIAPQNYYVDGYTYRKRPISNKVLIFFGGGDLIVYVWIDNHGRVEDVFIGGS